jgi:hypothetical protein
MYRPHAARQGIRHRAGKTQKEQCAIEQSLAPLLAGPATAVAGQVIVHTLA